MVYFSVQNWSCHNLKVNFDIFLKTRKIRIIESIWIAFYVNWLYGYILWNPPVVMVYFSVQNKSCNNLKVNFDIFFKNSKNSHNRIFLNHFLCNLIIWLNSVKTMWHHGLFSVKNLSCHNLKVNFNIFFKNSKNSHNRIYLNSFLCNMIIWLYSVETTRLLGDSLFISI